MSDAPILTEKHGHVMTITLNRPEAMNAITPHMLQDLNQAFKNADDDIDTRVVLLTRRRSRLLLWTRSQAGIRRRRH